MNERQINLLECIDDFESLRTNLMANFRNREMERDDKTFNINEYIA